MSKEMGDYQELAGLATSFMPITSQDEIERLLDEGYVTKEVADRVRRASDAKGMVQKSVCSVTALRQSFHV